MQRNIDVGTRRSKESARCWRNRQRKWIPTRIGLKRIRPSARRIVEGNQTRPRWLEAEPIEGFQIASAVVKDSVAHVNYGLRIAGHVPNQTRARSDHGKAVIHAPCWETLIARVRESRRRVYINARLDA